MITYCQKAEGYNFIFENSHYIILSSSPSSLCRNNYEHPIIEEISDKNTNFDRSIIQIINIYHLDFLTAADF